MSRPLVTVKTLIAQARERGAVELPAGTLITPAAADWLRGCRVPVRRVGAAEQPRESGPTFYLIGDPADATLRTLLPALERRHGDLQFLSCEGRRSGLLAAVRTMCAGLKECSRRRGVIVVNHGAIPCCVANKYAHVRAAIVPQPSALFSLQRELGINVLVIEKGRTSLSQAQALIEAFLTGKTELDPVIEAAIAGVSIAPAAGTPDSCGCRS